MSASRRHLRTLAAPLVAAIVLAACGKAPTAPAGPAGPVLPDPNVVPTVQREFRGLWVATVANIDWPSRAGLTEAQQRAELTALLDKAVAARMNAIVFHVRPAADAVYRSALEPWGAMLSGTQGVDPGWDPLEVAVREAHARGLELHAWVNPFRAGNTSGFDALASTHVAKANPELVRTYGTQLWMDPGLPEVHDRTMAVVLDIVQRYDVDAVHLDDYFYPYPQSGTGGTLPFPDDESYAQHGGGMSRDDWRRDNVNRFVERLYREVHEARADVKVGISPFGIWRPGNPPGITGLDAYASIYADARRWLQSGWVDYLAPQLYWAIDPPQQSFTALLDWWQQQNTRARHVWPGLATYRLFEGTTRFTMGEILRQVEYTRTRNTRGVLFYNTTTTLSRNGGEVANGLVASPFAQVALPPAYPWLDSQRPATPTVVPGTSVGGAWSATVTPADADVRWWLVRYRAGSRWYVRTIFSDQRILTLSAPGATVDWVVLEAVDRYGNTSDSYTWKASG